MAVVTVLLYEVELECVNKKSTKLRILDVVSKKKWNGDEKNWINKLQYLDTVNCNGNRVTVEYCCGNCVCVFVRTRPHACVHFCYKWMAVFSIYNVPTHGPQNLKFFPNTKEKESSTSFPFIMYWSSHCLSLYSLRYCQHCWVAPNSMEQSPSGEASNSSASQEISCILLDLTVHYCIHNSLTLVPILRQSNQVHVLPSFFRIMLMLSSHLCLGLPRCLFALGFLTKTLYAFSLSCPSHLIYCDLITWIVFGGEYRVWSIW